MPSYSFKTERFAYGGGWASVDAEQGECDVCHKTAAVLAIDTSAGEYAVLQICKDCIEQVFAGTVPCEHDWYPKTAAIGGRMFTHCGRCGLERSPDDPEIKIRTF